MDTPLPQTPPSSLHSPCTSVAGAFPLPCHTVPHLAQPGVSEQASERLSAYRIHNLYALSASAGCRCTQLPTSHPAAPLPPGTARPCSGRTSIHALRIQSLHAIVLCASPIGALLHI